MAYRVGSGEKKILLTGGIHAREYITCELVKMFMHKNYDFQLVCVPYSNIDGTFISVYGLESVFCEKRKNFLLYVNNGSRDFSLFKANANAVDLNVNFPAEYATCKSNKFFPATSDYVGEYALSEPENIAMAELCEQEKFDAAICLHCKGEEIYWKFHQKENLCRDKKIGKHLANSCKYKLSDYMSCGGLKDWLVLKYKLPAYTVEVGSDKLTHPLKPSLAVKIFPKIECLPQILANYL